MKRTKEQKGITLIALIITIVVLLILAAVAISSISNDGILHYATNAADSWNKAQTNEQATLDSYLSYLDNLKYQQCPGHTYVNGVCSNCGYPCQHEWEGTNAWWDNEPVICKICELECEHADTTPDYSTSAGYHIADVYCNLCGYIVNDFEEECTLVNGICTKCGIACDHGESSWEYGLEDIIGVTSYVSNDNGTHKVIGTCLMCEAENIVVYTNQTCQLEEDSEIESYTANNNGTHMAIGKCVCGASVSKQENCWINNVESCTSNNNGTHNATGTCACGATITLNNLECEWYDGEEDDKYGFCIRCNYECKHPYTNGDADGLWIDEQYHTYTWSCGVCNKYFEIVEEHDDEVRYSYNGDGTHTVSHYCASCEEGFGEDTVEQCESEDECTKCWKQEW